MIMKKYISHSERETIALGKDLGKNCHGGEIFLLIGDLGAGKTCLAKGLAKGLGFSGKVNSPTFNIMKIYKIKGSKKIKNFCHIDTYRLNKKDNLTALGFEEFLNDSANVSLIEWAEKIIGRIKINKAIKITLANINQEQRLIKIYEPKNF